VTGIARKDPSGILEEIARPNYPVSITLDTTSYCNSRCTMCAYPDIVGDLPMGYVGEPLFEKVVTDFAEIGRRNDFIPEINFCNVAEPFMDPRIIEHTEKCVNLGMNVYFNTNARALTKERTDQLKQIGFFGRFVLNVSGISPDVYERVMGVPQDGVLENVDYLIANHSREKIKVQASVVDWPKSEFGKARRYWRERNVRFSPILPNSRAGLVTKLKPSESLRVMDCSWNRILRQMIVTFEGIVLLCCQDMRQQVKVGDLRQQSIEEVWNGNDFCEVLKKIYSPEHSGNDLICADCSFALHSRSVFAKLKKNVAYEIRKAWALRHFWGL